VSDQSSDPASGDGELTLHRDELATATASAVIDGVIIVRPRVFRDERGCFVETYRREWVPGGREMIQANRGDRGAGCIVGLHYHLHQADYWYVPNGWARVVLHDLREGSPTDGATQLLDLGEVDGGPNEHLGIYIPPGVAHGFAAITDLTITYLVDGYYNPADELGVAWDDPAIAADWGVTDPVLSDRDRSNPRRSELPVDRRPHHQLRSGA
jgi:dTDP-4-dehydrorhamnose 3,5-epimerase